MDKVNDNPLFDTTSAQYVLGAIMHEPELLYGSDKYILSVDDFPEKSYNIIFGGIYNLAFEGAKHITTFDLITYLKGFEVQYDYIENNNGLMLLDLIYDSCNEFDVAIFNYHYNRVKKFSTLRDLRTKGISIEEFYNPSFLNKEEEDAKFDKLTVSDILLKIRNKIQLIENRNVSKQEATGQYAAKGLRELVSSLKQYPEVGIPFEGTLVNYATRGCRKGKMYLYSAPSGGGKTRTMLGNACSIAFPRIENGKVVQRKELEPVLFIATEMGADEIQTLILSWVSGVNEKKILMNMTTEDEDKLVAAALNIIEKYEKNFIIESIPNPSIQNLKSMITNYIIHDDIEYIFYDYIFSSVGLIDEFKSINLREDVVLMMLSNTLKEIAATYNVFVMTGTQLNGEWEKKTVRNANMLRGSKAIADKIDIGMIGVRAPDDELTPIKEYCQHMNYPMPNIVIDIYKNRRGEMCDIKIFRCFDYGTCRVRDIVATTNSSYKIINDIPPLVYETVCEDLSKYE